MKKLLHKLIAVLASALLAVALTACEDTQPLHAAVILGAHSNAPVVSIAAMKPVMTDICAADGSTVTVLIDDGAARQVGGTVTVNARDDRKYTGETRQRLIDARVQQLLSAAGEVTAAAPQVDLLGAIRLAARDLAQYPAGESRVLLILDPMLNTCAPFDMSQHRLEDLDAQLRVAELTEQSWLPDLSGVQVIIVGCGDTAAPQEPLNPAAVDSLRGFWQLFFTRAGAAQVTFSAVLPSGETYTGLPAVSCVPTVSYEVSPDLPLPAVTVLDPTAVAFLPDSTEFASPEAALAALTPVAEALNRTHRSFLLAGSTATVGGDEAIPNTQQFSLQRAAVLRAALIDLGVDPAQLTCIGLGQAEHPWRSTTDQALNRVVYLVDLESDEGRTLLGIGLRD